MKLDKLGDILESDSHRVELTLKDKINEIIDLIICSKCGNVKGLVGGGICFDCSEKEKQNE